MTSVKAEHLAIKGGSDLPLKINKIMNKFDYIVTTQDFHPKDHISFQGWPRHCVINTIGSQLHPLLNTKKIHHNFIKGFFMNKDSYSGFTIDGIASSGLDEYLCMNRVKDVYICGLALDYCVKATALDAIKLQFNVNIIIDCCASVSPENNEDLYNELAKSNIKFITSNLIND